MIQQKQNNTFPVISGIIALTDIELTDTLRGLTTFVA